jgi:hypothetical protein
MPTRPPAVNESAAAEARKGAATAAGAAQASRWVIFPA